MINSLNKVYRNSTTRRPERLTPGLGEISVSTEVNDLFVVSDHQLFLITFLFFKVIQQRRVTFL